MSYNLHVDIKAKPISYGSSRTAADIKFIVLHFTANQTDTAKNNALYFQNSNTRAAGAHYFVDQKDVYQSIDDLKVAYAVGGSRYANYKITGGATYYGGCTNKNSISIEMCSCGGEIASETFANAVELAKVLKKKYNVSDNHVIRHFDVNGKACPGWKGWLNDDDTLWKKFIAEVKKTSTSTKKTYSGELPTSVLKVGYVGGQVKLLQKFLNWYKSDFKLVVDGDFGFKTSSALKVFQANEKLAIDSIWGPKCLAAAKKVKR